MLFKFEGESGQMYAIGTGKLIKAPRVFEGKKSKVCNFSCEIESVKTGRKNERGYDEYESTYMSFACFGKLVDYCRNLEKSDVIAFAGRLDVDDYWTERSNDGETKYRVMLDFCCVQPEVGGAVASYGGGGGNPFTDLDDDELPDFL